MTKTVYLSTFSRTRTDVNTIKFVIEYLILTGEHRSGKLPVTIDVSNNQTNSVGEIENTIKTSIAEQLSAIYTPEVFVSGNILYSF